MYIGSSKYALPPVLFVLVATITLSGCGVPTAPQASRVTEESKAESRKEPEEDDFPFNADAMGRGQGSKEVLGIAFAAIGSMSSQSAISNKMAMRRRLFILAAGASCELMAIGMNWDTIGPVFNKAVASSNDGITFTKEKLFGALSNQRENLATTTFADIVEKDEAGRLTYKSADFKALTEGVGIVNTINPETGTPSIVSEEQAQQILRVMQLTSFDFTVEDLKLMKVTDPVVVKFYLGLQKLAQHQ